MPQGFLRVFLFSNPWGYIFVKKKCVILGNDFFGIPCIGYSCQVQYSILFSIVLKTIFKDI